MRPKTLNHPAHEAYRLKLQESQLTPTSPWSQLRSFPITPLSRLDDDLIIIPEEWAAAGSSRQLSARTIRVLDYLPPSAARDSCIYHEQQLRRIIFALLMVPRMTNTGVRRLGPHTWILRSRVALKMARWSIETNFNPGSLFAHLPLSQLAVMTSTVGLRVGADLNRDLIQYGERGLLNDVPSLKSPPKQFSDTERSYKGSVPQTDIQDEADYRTRPLSDDFVTRFIRICLFMSLQLGPPLLRAYSVLCDTSKWQVRCQQAVLKRRLALLASIDWRLGDGSEITELPFSIKLRSNKNQSAHVEHWPPRNWTELRQLFTFLQCANYNIVAFTTGARWSEHASASLDCISDGFDPTFRARTFKMVNMVGGKQREWPLIKQALAALRIQQEYATLVGGRKNTRLWVTVNRSAKRSRGSAQNIMNENNSRFVEALNLSGLLEGSHRWRATMARLGAIALTDAPLVLMELFGHRDMVTTFRYIFSNPDMRRELDEAYAAAAYALTGRLVDEPDGFEGPAAARLQSMIDDITKSDNSSEPIAESRESILEVLSATGPVAKAVRAGILCIKQPGQYGPCAKGYGAPNPARCKVECEHRLEDKSARQEVDRVISSLVDQLEQSDVQEQTLISAEIEGQVLTQLRRFPDLADDWSDRSSIVQSIWTRFLSRNN